ncbi:hypothetical protein RBU60_12995 [Mesonia sp. MT50]|uniref:Uncharacterized protein n=1 Tax=Mesonia profundi TaxID=3070998 RepID=A0ABU1A453_9FLAO|nr:hypothetical protein [Mesonia profundi]MDQ7918488.1 hypothetical protein [Mesonia profundi]
MNLLIKILIIPFIFGGVYLWNRFIIKNVIKGLIGFHKKYNVQNLHRQPVKFVVEHEQEIYKFASGFYWLGAVIISMSLFVVD